MKSVVRTYLTIICLLVGIYAYAQAPGRQYGEYKYSYSIDSNGYTVERSAFPRIQPIVVTTNFGFVQSSASYMYMGVGGVWLNSPIYQWAGFQDGWYVYAYRIGPNYSYFLISGDFDTIRIQETYNNGIVDVYTHCDPNERMNNAPTY